MVRVSAACDGQILFGPANAIGTGSALDLGDPAGTGRAIRFVIPAFVGVPAVNVTSGRYVFGVTCGTSSTSLTNVMTPFAVTAEAASADFVGMAPTSDGGGYWLAQRSGGVYSYGDAAFSGSLPGLGVTPAAPITGIAATADGRGYWLVGADGGVFSFGDAVFHGSLPSIGVTPIDPIVGIAATRDGNGYWLIGADGGVFTFGDAPYCPLQYPPAALPAFLPAPGTLLGPVLAVGIAAYPPSVGYGTVDGSADGTVTPLVGYPCQRGLGEGSGIFFEAPRLVGMISGIAVSHGGNLWLVGNDGGVFAPQVFGPTGPMPPAPFYGSLPSLGITPNAAIVGICPSPDGGGYWLLGTDGGVFAFGDAVFHGSAA